MNGNFGILQIYQYPSSWVMYRRIVSCMYMCAYTHGWSQDLGFGRTKILVWLLDYPIPPISHNGVYFESKKDEFFMTFKISNKKFKPEMDVTKI